MKEVLPRAPSASQLSHNLNIHIYKAICKERKFFSCSHRNLIYIEVKIWWEWKNLDEGQVRANSTWRRSR